MGNAVVLGAMGGAGELLRFGGGGIEFATQREQDIGDDEAMVVKVRVVQERLRGLGPALRRSMRHQRGISLIEVVVVMVLLAIVASISYPSMNRAVRRTEGKKLATTIVNSLRMARNQAMSTGEIVLLRIEDLGSPRLNIYRSTMVGGQRKRSCSEASASDISGSNLIETINLNGVSNNHDIHRITPDAARTDGFCFMPDGRVLGVGGAVLWANPPGVGCSELGMAVEIVTRLESGNAYPTDSLLACDDNAETRAQRDVDNVYRVRISYNGTVELNQ